MPSNVRSVRFRTLMGKRRIAKYMAKPSRQLSAATTPVLIANGSALALTSNAADDNTSDDDRLRSPDRGTGRHFADFDNDLTRGINDALLFALIIGIRQFDQFRQAHGLVLP